MRLVYYIFFVILLINNSLYAQDSLRTPLNIPMYLSGSFAELRPNHFHSGIDIKTNTKTGYSIYAVESGWVSRIKVSSFGYGLAIYIDHPNGLTSVYAHLDRFNDSIAQRVLRLQYQKKSFSFDQYFKPDEIPVALGQIIGYSGNSGGSFGPHLHFELRETKTQFPINPMPYFPSIIDTICPNFEVLVVYSPTKNQWIKIENKVDSIIELDTILVDCISPRFGIVTKDFSNGSESDLGINTIKLYFNQELVYQYNNQIFSFDESKYVNAHIDYKHYKTYGSRIEKLFREPGDKLHVYRTNYGDNPLLPDSISDILIEIFDSKQNKHSLKFKARYHTQGAHMQCPEAINNALPKFRFDKENYFENEDVKLTVKKGSLYQDFYFEFSKQKLSHKTLSTTYSIHKDVIPLHQKAELSIKITDFPDSFKSKLVIWNGKSSLSSRIKGEWISASISKFGDYSLMLDTVPPLVELVKVDTSALTMFVFKVDDKISGITDYEGSIDGTWVLMEYEPKNQTIFYKKDMFLSRKSSERLFEIRIKDDVGNVSNYKVNFTY